MPLLVCGESVDGLGFIMDMQRNDGLHHDGLLRENKAVCCWGWSVRRHQRALLENGLRGKRNAHLPRRILVEFAPMNSRYPVSGGVSLI